LRLIDTHCHLFVEQFKDDISEVIKRASAVGISDILMPAIDRKSTAAMNLLPNHQDQVKLHNMVGIHPCDVHLDKAVSLEELISWAKEANAIAIGETGLDYYWSREHIDLQKNSLSVHFEAAKACDLPIVLHNRDSTDDFLSMIEQAQNGHLKGVWHCFNGSVDEGKRAIDAGFYLGLGGVITFKNGGMDKVLPSLPLSRFILETDSPYLTPTPFRGKRNEPSYTALVAKRLAEILQKSEEEIAETTTKNAAELFGIK
jgi:TatD DNase family protein